MTKADFVTCAVHCWHLSRGPRWVVLPDGFVVQSCCRCHARRQVHADHAMDSRKLDTGGGMTSEPQQAEVADLRRQLAVVNESKSPCGHWSAHAMTNDGGKTIHCLECQVADLRRKLQAWESVMREAIAVMRVSNYDGIKLMAQSMERTLNAAQQAEEK